MKNFYFLFIILFVSLNTFGQDYQKIGNQLWSNSNLSVDEFRNGDKIYHSKNKEEWYKASFRGEPTWCYYNFDEKNSHFGKLYNYYAVSSQKKLAPLGWKVPTFFDYFELIKFLDPLTSYTYFLNNGSLAGGSLKIKNSEFWQVKNCEQISSGFNAIPSGGYTPSFDYPQYDWIEYGESARFWFITDWLKVFEEAFKNHDDLELIIKDVKEGKLQEKAGVIRLSYDNCFVSMDDDPKLYGYSVRLIKEIK